MGYGVQPYLFKSVEELEDVDLKKEIILNNDHYVFVHFCQMASNEQLQALLDESESKFYLLQIDYKTN